MAKTYKLTVEINSPSGLPRDAQQNNWWFEGPDAPDNVEWEAVRSALSAFYAEWQSSRSQFSLVGTGRLLARDVGLPSPAEPVYESVMTFGHANKPPLPLDCAAVVTFAAPPTPGVKVQSLRNRIYLGGLATEVNDSDGRIAGTFRTAVATGYNNFASALLANTDFEHIVYSPKLDDAFVVDEAWMNNQWDTQRRRDRPASQRTMFW